MTHVSRPIVAMVSDAIYPYHRGGKELRYHELTHRLARRADIHVYTMHWWDGPRVREDDGITLHAISRLLPLYVNGRRSLIEPFQFALCCLKLLRQNFDVLEADHIPFMQILALWLVTRLKHKRFVVTWHEVWHKGDWQEYLGHIGLAAWFVETLAMRAPDHIVAASPETAERLRKVLGSDAAITVAPNGIDIDEIRGTYPGPETANLVVVGRLMAHKRIDALLEVVAALRAEGLMVTCRIVGDGPERDALHAKARALRIDEAVDFRHDVREQKELYSLVKAAQVAVFPSAREGFGIAVLEALACGLPVITTSAPDNLAQHLVARASRGIVCDPSVSAIADAVKHELLREDVPDNRDLSDPWLAEYSWDTMTDRVAGVFRL